MGRKMTAPIVGVFSCLVAAWPQMAASMFANQLGHPGEGPAVKTLAASLKPYEATLPSRKSDEPSPEAKLLLSQLPGIDFSPLLQTPTKCVVLVSLQYFAVYTAIVLIRAIKQVWQVAENTKSSEPLSVVRVALEEVAASTDLLPMVAALFLATGQLVGKTQSDELNSCISSVITCVVVSGFLSMVICFWSSVRAQRSSPTGSPSGLGRLGSVAMILNYLSIAAVITALMWLKKPISDDIPAMMPVCLISLAVQYFVVYTALLLASWIDKLSPGVYSSLALQAARAASSEQRLGPMLSVLVMVLNCRSKVMRRSVLDPWTQNFFLACTFGLLIQTLLSASTSFCSGTPRQRLPGLLEFIAMLRWGVMCCVYAAAFCAAVSELSSPSVASSSVLSATLCYVSQYFLVHMSCFVVDVVQEVRGDQDEIDARESQGLPQGPQSATKRLACALTVVKDAVMFCPMASALLLANTIRATQFHIYANPSMPSQEFMRVGMWASLIQLSVSVLIAVLVMIPPEATSDSKPSERQKLKQACASFLVFCQCICLVIFHASIMYVIWSTLQMNVFSISYDLSALQIT